MQVFLRKFTHKILGISCYILCIPLMRIGIIHTQKTTPTHKSRGRYLADN